MELIHAAQLFDGEKLHSKAAILVDREGVIQDVGPSAEMSETYKGKVFESRWDNSLVLPGNINAHSHCWQVLLRGRADHPKNFHDWVQSHLYPTVSKLSPRGVEVAGIVAFSQMIRNGTTSLGEFHYIHNAEDQKLGAGLDSLVIDAARRVGLRLSFIRCLYDSEKHEGQKRFAESVSEAEAAYRELVAKYQDDGLVKILPAPHSLHGASAEMIQLGHALAVEYDTPFHIHLAEQQSDLEFSAKLYGCSPVQALDKLGVLDERCQIVHGIWNSEADLALLAERGCGLVYNPTTNMALGDGIAPMDRYFAHKIPVCLGTDANYGQNLFEEARTMEYLQRVKQLEMGVLTGEAGIQALLSCLHANAARALGLNTGKIAKSYPADMMAIDLSDVSLIPGNLLGGDALLSAVISSLSPRAAIQHVLVQGQRVVAHGQTMGLTDDELCDLIREELG